jgi:hypothetical protein
MPFPISMPPPVRQGQLNRQHPRSLRYCPLEQKPRPSRPLDLPGDGRKLQLRPRRVPARDALDVIAQVGLAVDRFPGSGKRRQLCLVLCYFWGVLPEAHESDCDVSEGL